MRAISAEAADTPVKPRMPATIEIKKKTKAHLRSVTAVLQHASQKSRFRWMKLPPSYKGSMRMPAFPCSVIFVGDSCLPWCDNAICRLLNRVPVAKNDPNNGFPGGPF
jgi:hypothetical protein